MWGVGWVPPLSGWPGCTSSADYQDTSRDAPAYVPPLSFYNSRQDEDLSGTVVAGHLYAGLDYDLNARTSWGVKLTYSMMSGFESKGDYAVHPFHEQDPDLLNHNTFSGLSPLDARIYRQTPVRQLKRLRRVMQGFLRLVGDRRKVKKSGPSPHATSSGDRGACIPRL